MLLREFPKGAPHVRGLRRDVDFDQKAANDYLPIGMGALIGSVHDGRGSALCRKIANARKQGFKAALRLFDSQ